jgi:plasmid rolling circle replication initiator protein Rep
MFYSFKKLTANKNFKTSVEGFFRALEVTYNAETDTYHPHFHCILIVLKSYFTSRDYIKQKDWVNMWQKASKLDYAPVVDIRKVNALTYKTVAEVSKYTVKTNDLFIYDENNNLDELKTMEVVETLDNALARRRLFSFGGVAKEAHKLLNLEDLNDTDLINIDGEEEIREDIFKLLEFTWSNKHKNYIFNSYVDK